MEPTREITMLSDRRARPASALAPERIEADTLGLLGLPAAAVEADLLGLSANAVEAVLAAGALMSLSRFAAGT
jgi:hypothetical protein